MGVFSYYNHILSEYNHDQCSVCMSAVTLSNPVHSHTVLVAQMAVAHT